MPYTVDQAQCLELTVRKQFMFLHVKIPHICMAKRQHKPSIASAFMYNIVKSTFVSASVGKRYNQCLFRYAAHQLNKEPKPNVKNVKDNYLIYNFDYT